MELGTKQLQDRCSNHTHESAKPRPIRAHSCNSCKTSARFFPVKLIRVYACSSVVQRFPEIKNYQTNPFWNSRFCPQTKGFPRFPHQTRTKNEPISATVLQHHTADFWNLEFGTWNFSGAWSLVRLELLSAFQKATTWSIPNRVIPLRRIKRNIHCTNQNFSSCKTCMIWMNWFQHADGWHRRCLNAARTREMRFPVTEPEQLYEENRSDY